MELTGMRLGELEALLDSRPRALEVIRWLHGPRSEESVPNIRAESWKLLREHCRLPSADILEKAVSDDGTTRFLLSFGGAKVETVRIPSRGRTTLCLSCQSGCTRHCQFCATATLGFGRNLLASEMLTQFWLGSREALTGAPVRNVVFMGMGEPMDNLDQVLLAIELLTQVPAPRLRAERITVSTSGVLPGMVRFLRESKASLALSLNATTDAQREGLMPHTRQWPIGALLDALREDKAAHPKRVHFIEYVMFEGLNDQAEDAQRLVGLLEGINARVNLIPHNPVPGNSLRGSSKERVMDFQKRLASAGLRCLVRWPRGSEVAAACGQLARTSAS